jgi:serine/threonine protein kinase/tetratricopeptide (TPR) repeat protein
MAAQPIIGRTIGSYRIEARIGAGGMGEVYRAHDGKLDRPVALKMLPPELSGEPDRLQRFHREARAISSLNHPHILVIHDFGELDGRPFIVTEFIEGETLRARLARGPIAVADAVGIATEIASALAAAHERGIIHRDIKPENVMLRPDGYVKVLDFGLAKVVGQAAMTSETVSELIQTVPGFVAGTPRYMSPEQTRGEPLDARTDVWSLGVVLYEMLAGRPPFGGGTIADIVASVLHVDARPIELHTPDTPPSVCTIVRKALTKNAAARFPSAHEMYKALKAEGPQFQSGSRPAGEVTALPRPTRVIVLPFRILKADAETDFLAFSLPDAVAAALANLESVVVRSSLSIRITADADLRAIAERSGVEMVVVGTMVRAGDRLRVSSQLIDGATGTLVWSHTDDVALGDLFRLQDSLVDGLVRSLELPLTGRDRQQLRRDRPASAKAYEYYLRGNELSRDPSSWAVARDLYMQAIEQDPGFAPAWGRIARVYRLIAKYHGQDAEANLARAENALEKALRLNPDLSIAHHLLAQLDIDRGQADDALRRLIARARERGDAQIYAALVHACRVCGLMDASLAAHERARQIDASIETGVMHTYWLLHRFEDALAASEIKAYVAPASLVELGRLEEARALIADLEARSGNRVAELANAVRAFMDGRHADGVRALIAQIQSGGVPDPEMLFYVGRHLAHVGEVHTALGFIRRAFEGGYFCYPVFAEDSWLDPLRPRDEFQSVLAAARERSQRASALFVAAGGPALLDLHARTSLRSPIG